MEDEAIVNLYFDRDENAITETKTRYGKLLRSIAYKILKNREDAEECEDDTYVKAWNAMPPERPKILSAFLSKITRNLSLDRYRKNAAVKRGAGEMTVLLGELTECLPDHQDADLTNEIVVRDTLNAFLDHLPKEARMIFMRRYWFCDSVRDIAKTYGCSESKVKSSLMRSRQKLRTTLEREGISV